VERYFVVGEADVSFVDTRDEVKQRRVAWNGSLAADSFLLLARLQQVLEEKQVLAAFHVYSATEDRL
jgi:hypothetical protein